MGKMMHILWEMKKKKNPVISFLSHFIYDTQKFTQLL